MERNNEEQPINKLFNMRTFFSILRVTGFVMDYIKILVLLDVVVFVDKAAAVDGKRGHGALLRLCRLFFPLPQALQAERLILLHNKPDPVLRIRDPVLF
jgi:hypothetical protein